MSPAAATEDRLRRDLDDLAPAPPPDLLALAAVSRAVGRRRRRRRGVALAAGTALVAAALVAPALVQRERRSDAITPASDPTPAPTTAPPGPQPTTEGTAVVPPTTVAPPVPDAAAATGSAPGERVAFANASLALPDGWAVAERDGDRSLCIAPAGNPAPHWDGCGGLMLNHGNLPGFEDAPYEIDGDWAWYHHTDVVPCPSDPDPKPGDPLDGVQGDGPGPDKYAPVDSGLRKVGSHTANYDQWAARCQLSGTTFRPRAWQLPASQIVIFDVLERPETEQILRSFQFT
ncbi:MAG TPA: hypothetical protein VKB57_05875 [Acidimicrobiales bacterium]|nr:hypothetical protein [Acidimicrobiales bacterium]